MDDTDTAAEAAATPPVRHPLDEAVERWWNAHFPGSPVAQVTAAWNHALAAKEDLKRLLREEF